MVRGGILERLLSLLETHGQYGYCSEAEELLAGASRQGRARLAPREQEQAVNAAQPVLSNGILPAALSHSFEVKKKWDVANHGNGLRCRWSELASL